MKLSRTTIFSVLASTFSLGVGCEPSSPETNSQTNWLKHCDTEDDCGDLVCLCGTCTRSCDTVDDCSDPDTDSCVSAGEEAASIVCDGNIPTAGLCLPRCDSTACPGGASCVAGVCRATPAMRESLTVDLTREYQSLIGFGASLAYDEDFLVSLPEKEEVYDAMFQGSGFDIIRFGNRLPEGGEPAALGTAEIIDAATTRLGRAPFLFMTSGSPPPELKANGDRYCVNQDPDCTLARDVDGQFDYAAFAEHWRSSLEAYAAVGIEPDFVSIQNNANWIPSGDPGAEACKFLPVEGTESMVAPDGTNVEVEFPGYTEAVAAVSAALSTLPGDYSLTGPELFPIDLVGSFAPATEGLDSLSINFYSLDAADVDVDTLETLRSLSEESQKPILQSEVHVSAKESAVLIHHALATLGASAYMQQGFVGASEGPTDPVLVGVTETGISKNDTYHVLSHFARYTDPGWVRVDAQVSSEYPLSTAWRSEDSDELTVVLVNPTEEAIDIEMVPPGESRAFHVYRTTLDTEERFAALGPIPTTGFVRLPPSSIVTIATEE